MRRRSLLPYAAAAALAALVMSIDALQDEANYDEAKVPAYTLPDPLRAADGSELDAETWRAARREEVLELFRRHVYGRAPGRPAGMTFTVRSRDEALGGAALREQVTVRFTGAADGPALDLLLYLPRNAEGPVPVFCGLNFCGNHAVQPDPGVDLPTGWMMRDDPERGYVDHRATEASRGAYASRWPVPEILARGYGLATVYYGDLDPDFDDGFRNGVHALDAPPGEDGRAPDAWGAIGAWAWGLSRVLDYLESDPDVDAGRVAVVGHSRLGKTALWAGARDERFALVISNDSGCGGAALWRRRYGETLERITRVFPHWFCGDLRRFAGREDELPVDQHMLIALCAPRPVLVCSAAEDRWADPRGEFLSALHAGAVFERLGGHGLPSADFPAPGELSVGDVGYFLRAGGHDMTADDWAAYLDFADHHLGHGGR